MVADGKLDFANPTVSQSVQSVQLFNITRSGNARLPRIRTWNVLVLGCFGLGLVLVGCSLARHAYIQRGMVADGKLDFANPTVSQFSQFSCSTLRAGYRELEH